MKEVPVPRLKQPVEPEMKAIRRWLPRAGCRGHDPRIFDTVVTRKHRTAPGGPVAVTLIDDNVGKAREVCAECPVMLSCLEHALTYGHLEGVWGGLVAEERLAWLDQATAPVAA